jgi:uncharacterized protein (UPF0335 family)
MQLGKNTASGVKLLGFVESIERLREQKKAIANDEGAAFAAAKAEGFSPARLRDVLKIRAMNPHEREEAEAELEMYLHAIGMAKEAPLFRAVGLMAVDTAARDQVIDAMKLLVPPNGEFILKIGGTPVRVWRDKDGNTFAEDVKEQPKADRKSGKGYSAPAKQNVPDVNQDGAATLGREAYKAGAPIISNPFPWDDARRSHWDRGWREESGSDGMGPDSEE